MDKIFSHFLSRGDDKDARRLANASWFIEAIPIDEFESEEKLYWKFIEYCSKLNVPLKLKYFDVWLDTELRSVLRNTNVHVSGCEQLNYNEPLAFETAVSSSKKILRDNYLQLEVEVSDLDDFNVDMAAYFTNKKNDRLTESLTSIYHKLSDTNDADIASEYAADLVNNLNHIYDKRKLEDLGASHGKTKMEFVTDCGIEPIDKDSGGLHTTQLFGIEAQPGTGKTRFTMGTYMYRAAVLYKKNVVFYSLEQTVDELEAMLIATHVFYMFGLQLNDKIIRKGTYPKEYAAQVEAARYDLFESGKYGKLVCLEDTFHVKTFVNRLRTIDKLKGPFDLVIIDYMGLIRGDGDGKGSRDMTLADRINDSYEFFKAYVRRSKKAGIAIGQFNATGIDAGEHDKNITPDMAQGGIAVYRHTDYNIAISRTDAMKLQQKCRFSLPKVRSSAGFERFIADTRLGFCYFKQAIQKQV